MKPRRMLASDAVFRCGMCLSFVQPGEKYYPTDDRLIINGEQFRVGNHSSCPSMKGNLKEVENAIVLERDPDRRIGHNPGQTVQRSEKP